MAMEQQSCGANMAAAGRHSGLGQSVSGSGRNLVTLCWAVRVHSAWGLNHGESKRSPH